MNIDKEWELAYRSANEILNDEKAAISAQVMAKYFLLLFGHYKEAKREADSIHYGLIEAYLCMRLSFFKERRIRSDELDTVREYCRPGSIDEVIRKIETITEGAARG